MANQIQRPESTAWAARPVLAAPAAATRSTPVTRFESDSSVNVNMAAHAVGRWWKVALPTGLILASIGAVIVWLLFEPQYESAALLQIKSSNPYIVFDDKQQSKSFVSTQVGLMTRRTILADALKGMERLPELEERDDPIEWVQQNIMIYPVGQSEELFEVKYRAAVPEDAKAIVDSVVETYLLYVDRQDSNETRRIISLLKEERSERKRLVDRLRSQVREQTKQLTGKDPFSPLGRETVTLQTPLAQLMNQLVNAEVDAEVAEAKLKVYADRPDSEPEVSERDLRQAVEQQGEIVALKDQITSVSSQMHTYAASTKDAERTPTYRRYQRQIQGYEDVLEKLRGDLLERRRTELIAQARQAREQVIREYTAQIENAKVTIDLLKKRYEEQVRKLEQSGGDTLELEFLRTEMVREEKVFEMIADRTLALQTELAAPARVTLLDEAHLPVTPVERAPWTPLTLVSLIGLCCPFALAVLWEKTAKRVGDATVLTRSDLNVVAEVAALPVKSRRGSSLGNERSQRELSLFEESIDSLRTGLRLSRQLRDLQVLAVSSAVSREGKTSLASQLAVSIARASGEKTLLIDADMRSPNIHQIFDTSNEKGLATVLADNCSLEDAIVTDYSELLHLLPAGELTASPHKLVGDDSLEKTISQLREKYRYIIIDTPPVLSAGESLVLSVAADATLICAMRNYSRAQQVREAYTRLLNADAKPIGVVLNGVPIHRYYYSYGKYGYGRYSYRRR